MYYVYNVSTTEVSKERSHVARKLLLSTFKRLKTSVSEHSVNNWYDVSPPNNKPLPRSYIFGIKHGDQRVFFNLKSS